MMVMLIDYDDNESEGGEGVAVKNMSKIWQNMTRCFIKYLQDTTSSTNDWSEMFTAGGVWKRKYIKILIVSKPL